MRTKNGRIQRFFAALRMTSLKRMIRNEGSVVGLVELGEVVEGEVKG